MLPAAFVLTLAALLGLAFGSFLNVCIVRLPAGGSVVSPRSRCSACDSPIGALDNIPLLSFALLRGRCRACSARIGFVYPMVEAATAAWFVLSVWPTVEALRSPAIPPEVLLAAFVHAASVAVLGFLLIGLAVMDWQTHLLPNEFTLGGLALGALFALAESFFVTPVPTKTLFTPEEVRIAGRLGAALAGFLLLWLVRTLYRAMRKREGMGLGDAKLGGMLGIFLGPAGLGVAFFTGILLATAAAIALLATRRGNALTRIPFGSFLAAGGLFAAIWGDRIYAWYRTLFL